MAQPQIGPLGLLSAVYLAFASNIDNVMTYDAVAFLNSSLAILVGIAVAVVLVCYVLPRDPRLRSSPLSQAARATSSAPPSARPLRHATSVACSQARAGCRNLTPG
jgi:uncharacterized membrane protein YccC